MMDQQEVAQMALPLVQAMAEGKTVEVELDPGKWTKKVEVAFYPGAKYRIKPAPQYRPLTPEEALKHVGRAFKINRHHDWMRWIIESVSDNGIFNFSDPKTHPRNHMGFESLVSDFCWADDGTPCGVLVE